MFIQISLVITLVIAQQMLNSNFFASLLVMKQQMLNHQISLVLGQGATNAYQSTLVVELVVVQTNANASNFFDSKLVWCNKCL
jgi:hypothetical protein